ncbi:MAG TPA: YceI family protein [Acidobacteriaceae bacterium]|nr:YceI family protein [Acidobacteriaceae bacterium]
MRFVATLLLLAATISAHAQNQWVLEQSSITWHITHPVHEVDGTSHAAKGKGICAAGACDFLVAVPLNTFNSGDSSRDLHMLQVVRGAQFPMVIVRTHLPATELSAATIRADLEIQFAGQTVHYSQVLFTRTQHGADVEITGTIPATCSDFKIDRPSFLTVPIRNEIPVKIDLTWRPQ